MRAAGFEIRDRSRCIPYLAARISNLKTRCGRNDDRGPNLVRGCPRITVQLPQMNTGAYGLSFCIDPNQSVSICGGSASWMHFPKTKFTIGPSLLSEMKANQAVTPARFWRGSRDFKESGFPPETCGNDNFDAFMLRCATRVWGWPGSGSGEQVRSYKLSFR
jgi:hypothetical protein